MIKATAKVNSMGETDVDIELEGNGYDLIDEALGIVGSIFSDLKELNSGIHAVTVAMFGEHIGQILCMEEDEPPVHKANKHKGNHNRKNNHNRNRKRGNKNGRNQSNS